MRWNMNRGCERVASAIGTLFRSASGRSIYLSHPLQRRFQDFQAGMGHAFLVPDPLARAAGGNLLGASKPELVL
jgi:3-hydroxy-9,10-secoandrosta-1,3,5(10)-triene-9,17-dione monooxygenase